MVNILLEGYNLNEPWLKEELSNYLKPFMKVAIVAFSFRDNFVKNNSDWLSLYGRSAGKYYGGYISGFTSYGINEDNIVFINYFADTKDTALEKIKNADIIFFPGGLPDKMMERIKSFGIYEALCNFDKTIIGYSAGALIQLNEYHMMLNQILKYTDKLGVPVIFNGISIDGIFYG